MTLNWKNWIEIETTGIYTCSHLHPQSAGWPLPEWPYFLLLDQEAGEEKWNRKSVSLRKPWTIGKLDNWKIGVWKIGQNLLSRQHQRSIQKSNYAVQQARGPSFSHPTACWDDYETNRDYVSNNTFITLTLAYFCLRQWSSCWNKPFVYMWAVSRQLSKPVSSRLNV